MLGDDGLYQIYRRSLLRGNTQRRILGVLYVHDGLVEVTEDHDGELIKLFPPGPFDDKHLHRLEQLELSPYFMVYHDGDLESNGTQAN